MSLREYARKRNFKQTSEPTARTRTRKSPKPRFVIQKHAATRLHYDFRLEIDGTLKSWAVPKGIPLVKGEKRLAVQVEDHPLAYGDFEGSIPKGQYGGGTVMIWDYGAYEFSDRYPRKTLESGQLHFILHGKKLEGEWGLVRMKSEENQWLLIKHGADAPPISKAEDDTSALSNRSMAEIAKTGVTWESRPAARKIRRKAPVAVPLPKFVEPMYAKLVSQPRPGAWTYEIKFDGYRAIALKGGRQVRLLSRNEKDYGEKFSAINDAVSGLDCEDAILDGEVVALDNEGRPSFQLLQALEKGEQRPPLYYYIFDLLRLNGSDLCSKPLEERRDRLQSLLQDATEDLRFSVTLDAEINELLKKAGSFGLEGLVGKQLGSRYESGRRSGAWIKLKLAQNQEFVIGGYTPPAGGRKYFGALIVGYHSGDAFLFAAKVGSGFSDEILRSLYEQFQSIRLDRCPFANLPERHNGRWGQAITPSEMRRCHWVEPNLVCQVRFSEWTQDGKLRQPVFQGLRHDKAAPEVVRESAG
ncbi:MAG: non-homologous end-joining DNA ligase [Verrucomicrobia bacterium]|nr:non-homologous end-joining DNA ligase [Verrucomicrobiota bacterium]